MKLYLYSIIMCLCLTQTWAQYDYKQDYFLNKNTENTSDSVGLLNDTSYHVVKKNYIEIGAGYLVNSNAVTNEFVTDFYFGGAISRESRENTVDRLGDNNRIGVHFFSDLVYKRAFSSFNLTVGLNQSLISNNEISAGAVNIYFFGNAPFAGESLELASSSVSVYNYQSIEIGAEKKLNDRLFISGALNLFRGTSFYDLEVERGDLFTQVDGTEVTLDAFAEQTFYDGESDPGTGLGIDFSLAYTLLDNKGKISFQIDDIGYINYKNLVRNRIDSTYQFQGVELDNIFQLDQLNTDNLDVENFNETFGITEERVDRLVISPASFTLGYQGDISPSIFSISAYLNYRIINAYVPLLLIKPTYHITDYLSLAPIVSFGGLGTFDFGLAVEVEKGPFFLQANIYEFENLIAKSNSSGRGTQLKAGFLF